MLQPAASPIAVMIVSASPFMAFPFSVKRNVDLALVFRIARRAIRPFCSSRFNSGDSVPESRSSCSPMAFTGNLLFPRAPA